MKKYKSSVPIDRSDREKFNLRKQIFLNKMKEIASFEPDWNNQDEIKYYIEFGVITATFNINETTLYLYGGNVVYFKTAQDAWNFCDNNKEKLLELYFEIVKE